MPPDRVVLKTHQGEKGESAWEAMNVLWQHPGAWAHAVRLAEPLGYLPDERILVQGPVPEDCTLKDLARRAIAERDPNLLEKLRAALSTTARALAPALGLAYLGKDDLKEQLMEQLGAPLDVPAIQRVA